MNLLFVFADQWRAGALGYAKEDPLKLRIWISFVKNLLIVITLSVPFRSALLIEPVL